MPHYVTSGIAMDMSIPNGDPDFPEFADGRVCSVIAVVCVFGVSNAFRHIPPRRFPSFTASPRAHWSVIRGIEGWHGTDIYEGGSTHACFVVGYEVSGFDCLFIRLFGVKASSGYGGACARVRLFVLKWATTIHSQLTYLS